MTVTDYKAVLEYYPASVPRYTSYPTAPHFKKGAGENILRSTLRKINKDAAVSIYVHIPFCDRLCWFCGCHTKHTKKYAPIEKYIDHLCAEVELLGKKLKHPIGISHLHFGGGSPSLLKPNDLQRIKAALNKFFLFCKTTQISFEIDPSDASADMYEGLLEFGITRASIGVQDFDPNVQKAINRIQTFEQTQSVATKLRSLGITSLNIDALYGLPKQSGTRLERTINLCMQLSPDRITLFGYAHVPWLKAHQRLIAQNELAGSIERFENMQSAAKQLIQGGYCPVGIDHFAKPEDDLAIASKTGNLRRNFQGYTTDSAPYMFGFGASSIGRSPIGFIQNTIATNSYQQQISQGILPVDKGYELSPEDIYRGQLIEQIMCNFTIDMESIKAPSNDVLKSAFRAANKFATRDPFGLLAVNGSKLTIPENHRAFTRIVASQFDQYLRQSNTQYSKAV